METREKPIIMGEDSILAMWNERKTQTRRPAKKQPPANCRYINFIPGLNEWIVSSGPEAPFSDIHRYKSPYGMPGDRLWVRETWAVREIEDHFGGKVHKEYPNICYRADSRTRLYIDRIVFDYVRPNGWRSPIHMPRWASRWLLAITDIDLQFLSRITRSDAIAEGLPEPFKFCPTCRGTGLVQRASGMAMVAEDCPDCDTPLKHYRNWWNHLNTKRGLPFDADPLIWKVTFQILKGGRS